MARIDRPTRSAPRAPGAAAIAAAFAYFASVFALGFVLGALRMLVLMPRVPEPVAVAIEIPIMLGASWWLCGVLVRRFDVPPRPGARLLMGGLALLLLLAAEAGLALVVLHRSPAEHLASYRSAAAGLGMLAQLVFASFPLLRRVR